METQAPYHVTGSVLVLPAPSEADVRADLLSRIFRRCCEQKSFLRYPGSSLGWRHAADNAKDDVNALRFGRVPELAPLGHGTVKNGKPRFTQLATRAGRAETGHALASLVLLVVLLGGGGASGCVAQKPTLAEESARQTERPTPRYEWREADTTNP